MLNGQLHAPIHPLNVGSKNPIVTALYSTKKEGCQLMAKRNSNQHQSAYCSAQGPDWSDLKDKVPVKESKRLIKSLNRRYWLKALKERYCKINTELKGKKRMTSQKLFIFFRKKKGAKNQPQQYTDRRHAYMCTKIKWAQVSRLPLPDTQQTLHPWYPVEDVAIPPMFHTSWGTSSAHAAVPGWIWGPPVLPWTLPSLLYDGIEKTPLIAVHYVCSAVLGALYDVRTFPGNACCLKLIRLPSFASQTDYTKKIQVFCVSSSQHSEGTTVP